MLKEPINVEARLAGGGLGELLQCRDATGRAFVAKFPKDGSRDSQKMLVAEERRLRRHQGPYVVPYITPVRHPDGRLGFAMDLMDGSLADLVRKNGPLDQADAIGYCLHAASALAAMHASGTGAYHGDVKLANILHKAGTAKVADFGLARGGVGQTQYWGPHGGGTPGYLPPERVTSSLGDVYSLGVVLWALLAGREPHPQHGPNQTLELPQRLAALLNGMLHHDPSQRAPMGAVLKELQAMKGGLPGWLAGLGAIAAVVAVIAVVGSVFKSSK